MPYSIHTLFLPMQCAQRTLGRSFFLLPTDPVKALPLLLYRSTFLWLPVWTLHHFTEPAAGPRVFCPTGLSAKSAWVFCWCSALCAPRMKRNFWWRRSAVVGVGCCTRPFYKDVVLDFFRRPRCFSKFSLFLLPRPTLPFGACVFPFGLFFWPPLLTCAIVHKCCYGLPLLLGDLDVLNIR